MLHFEETRLLLDEDFVLASSQGLKVVDLHLLVILVLRFLRSLLHQLVLVAQLKRLVCLLIKVLIRALILPGGILHMLSKGRKETSDLVTIVNFDFWV